MVWQSWRSCSDRGRRCRRRRSRGRGSCSLWGRSCSCRCSWSRWCGDGVKSVQLRALAALDPIFGDADIVGGGAPAEVHPSRRSRSRQRPGLPRRGAVGRCAGGDRCRHVGLDLGGAAGDVVDREPRRSAREVLAVDAVAADLERVRGGGDRSGLRLAGDLPAVHVQPQRRRRRRSRPGRPAFVGQRVGAVRASA